MTLRDKLKALTAPCREVDAEIAEAFKYTAFVKSPYKSSCCKCPRYTASLDATVELVEREAPGWWWLLERIGGEHWAYAGGDIGYSEAKGKHKLPAVALLLALLDARGIE